MGIVLIHPDLEAEYEAVDDDQAEILSRSGWKRKPTQTTDPNSPPKKRQAKATRAARKTTTAAPADTSKTEEI